MRTAAKRDDGERAIIEALEAAGATVQQLSGGGIPDLLVGYGKRTVLLEVKSEGGSLTGLQAMWLAWWSGGPVAVVSTPGEALAAVGANRKRGK